jgi:hypothetical protein
VALAVEVVTADSDDCKDGGRDVWRNGDVVLVVAVVLVEQDDIPGQGCHCVSTGRKPETTTTANEDDINTRLHQGDRLTKSLISLSFDDATRILASFLASLVLLVVLLVGC